ncbi:MAG: hypothetical protein AAFX87_24595 [Bacteroidota bacterium]
MSKKTKYLTYIEETKKHHSHLAKVAKNSVKKAIRKSKENDVTVTYLEGNAIVSEKPNGETSIIEHIQVAPRKVKVGDTTTI